MFSKEKFVDRLCYLMDKHNITKQTLANNINISRPSVSKMTHGIILPSIDTLVSIAQYFGVSVDYLLGLTDNKERNE